jgi:hypothetical protein
VLSEAPRSRVRVRNSSRTLGLRAATARPQPSIAVQPSLRTWHPDYDPSGLHQSLPAVRQLAAVNAIDPKAGWQPAGGVRQVSYGDSIFQSDTPTARFRQDAWNSSSSSAIVEFGYIMNWRQTAFIPDGASPNDTDLNSIASAIPPDQHVRMACHVLRFQLGFGPALQGATVVLTNRNLIVAKDRAIKNARPDFVYKLSEVVSLGCGPLLGVGPTWEITFTINERGRGKSGSIYLPGPLEAEPVASKIGEAIRALHDPDLAQFQRSMDAAATQPPGELGGNMTREQIIAESRAIREMFASGNFEGAWNRRLQLGYVILDGVPQVEGFWLDAAPAIAALQLEMKDHPMVAMCCGMAESNCDHDDPAQLSAVEIITKLYHG